MTEFGLWCSVRFQLWEDLKKRTFLKSNWNASTHAGTSFLYKRTGYLLISNSTITKRNPSHTQNKVCLIFSISVAEFIWAVPPCKLQLIVLGGTRGTRISIRTLILFLSVSGPIMLSSSTPKHCVNRSLQQKCSWYLDNTSRVWHTTKLSQLAKHQR